VEPSPWAWSPGWPEVGGALALAGAYLLAQRRFPASPIRRALFGLGVLLIVLLFVSPVQTLATTYLLSAHFLQNVALAEWAPALILLGLSPAAAAALGRTAPVRVLGRPWVALPLWLATYAAWHVPAAYDTALRHQAWLLPLEHLCYFVAGLALWWPILGESPPRLAAGWKAAYLFAAFVLASPLGLLFALLPSPVYTFYEAAPRVFGLSALRDQQIAGMLMSIAEAVVFFAVFCLYFSRFLAEEDRGGRSAPSPEPGSATPRGPS
jgi:cytochrome c oxidase assembly factor CtaG